MYKELKYTLEKQSNYVNAKKQNQNPNPNAHSVVFFNTSKDLLALEIFVSGGDSSPSYNGGLTFFLDLKLVLLYQIYLLIQNCFLDAIYLLKNFYKLQPKPPRTVRFSFIIFFMGR